MASSKLTWTVFGPFLWGMLFYCGIRCSPKAEHAEAAMRQLSDQPVRALSEGTSGPGWFYGQMIGPSVSSPLGTPGALWIYEGISDTDDTTTLECSAQHGLSMELVDEGHRVKLKVPTDFENTWLRGRLEAAPHRYRRLQWLPRSCNAAWRLTYSQEVAIPSGTPVWVSGCFEGDAIGMCASGYDGLSTVSRSALASDMMARVSGRYDHNPIWGFFLLLFAVIFAAASLSVPDPR